MRSDPTSAPRPGSSRALNAALRQTVVVVPTFNEADSITDLLDRVLAAGPHDVLVVDDDSPDGTADLVRRRAEFGYRLHLLSRPGKSGLGAAYRAGFAWALDRGYSTVVQMDADLSHPPEAIASMVEGLIDGADLVIGSRYVPGGKTVNWSLLRKLISWAANAYVSLVLGLSVADSTAGFRAYRAETLRRIGVLDSTSNGYCFQIENTWVAARSRLRIREVPITFTERAAGTSKMSSDIVREAVLKVLVWRWRELTGPSGRGVVRQAEREDNQAA